MVEIGKLIIGEEPVLNAVIMDLNSVVNQARRIIETAYIISIKRQWTIASVGGLDDVILSVSVDIAYL